MRMMLLASSLALAACAESGLQTVEPSSRRMDEEVDAGTSIVDVDASVPAVSCLESATSFAVAGEDSRGSFTGFVQRRSEVVSFIRHVEWGDQLRAPDGRRVAWLWSGSFDTDARVRVTLRARDFVVSAHGLERSPLDPELVEVTGEIVFSDPCNANVTYTMGGETIQERWTATSGDNAATMFLGHQRVLVPSAGALSDAERAAIFAAFSSYHALPDVAPYASDPLFQEGRVAQIVDRTDFDYSRANPEVIRVIDKVLDVVSIAETAPRSTAWSKTLAEKSAFADQMMETKFFDPAAGCVVFGVITGTGERMPSGDGALWQGMYLVSQIERHRITLDPQALNNIVAALECLLRLQEIVPDKTQFARTLRTHLDDLSGGWVRGLGAYAHLDWLQGGNNDMFKGLMIGYAWSYSYLCKPAEADAALCARIRANARAAADDIDIADRPGANILLSRWLAAYVTSGLASLNYGGQASAAWLALNETQDEIAKLSTAYGVADWSGVHLNFATYLATLHLAEAHELPGHSQRDVVADVKATMRKWVDNFIPHRSVLWEMFGARESYCTTCVEDARWRMREFVVPKASWWIDHRLGSDFVMSPYPDVPWKGDWDLHDRTQSLYHFPLFELATDEYAWKNGGNEFKGRTAGYEPALVDFVFAYWFGRAAGVISASM